MSTRIHNLTLAAAICLTPTLALAWNPQGHQEVGAVAQQMIAGSHAEKWVKYLLGEQSLQLVSVWADCVRGVKSTDGRTLAYQPNPQYTECVPFDDPEGVKRMESFVERNWKQCGTTNGPNDFCHTHYHYTDVSNLRDHYQDNYTGTAREDVVHAINATILYLRGQTPPAPFSFADKREALILLDHYVGDISQPLHAAAIYLNADGKVIDPEAQGSKPGNETAGGNFIWDGQKNLHAEWDTPPANPAAFDDQVKLLLSMAKQVPPTSGDVNNWSTAWATDSIHVSKEVFAGLHFAMRPSTDSAHPENVAEKWDVSGDDDAYKSRADAIKMQQLAKASAHLAQVLKSIWPDDQPLPPEVK
jgi:hypothetical protein